MKPTMLGDLLHLKPYHHYYSIPVIQLNNQKSGYLVLFQDDNQLQLVNHLADNGRTQSFKKASIFSWEELLLELGAIPLDCIHQILILQAPRDKQQATDKPLQLKEVFLRYRKSEQVLSFLKQSPKTAQELANLEPEEERIRLANQTYDPFRSTVRQENRHPSEPKMDIVSDKEYKHLTDFHPFIQSQRGNVYKVPVDYLDPDKQTTVTIDIMGWYFYKKQLKIRWRPRHTRKGRWRSSLVSVDKKTGSYFFQGELYKKGNYPIFLHSMSFNKGIPTNFQEQFHANFHHFQSIIEDQKKKALLRIYSFGK
ncbi:hypothetical protein [Streptococcus suis]|uniref:hypothetical protein n=1 Tax=Streptococcus suis TaxID=1307 RepID=UPI001ABE57E1|nr:hypothetical protein [Streptococcus suis]